MSIENYVGPAVVGHYMGGQVVAGRGTRRVPVYNPTLGRVVREVALAELSLIHI